MNVDLDTVVNAMLKLDALEVKQIDDIFRVRRVNPFDYMAIRTNELNDEAAQARTVYVGNLGYETTKQQLEKFFQDCGEINDVRFPGESGDRAERGFAFVVFGTELSARRACGSNQSEFDDRRINVRMGEKKGSWKPPKKTLEEQIAYYFSDQNLRKDAFLRDKLGGGDLTGWVDVSLIATFPIVKSYVYFNSNLARIFSTF